MPQQDTIALPHTAFISVMEEVNVTVKNGLKDWML
jgi:hypothetical protein